MSVGQPRSYHKRFKFTIEIDGLTYAGFQTCSDLKGAVGEVMHREGGTLIPDKTPGLATFDDVTLTRGATNDRELYDKWKKVLDAGANGGSGEVDGEYDDEMDIVQRDRDGSELLRWRCFGAWIKEFTAGSWDNDAEEVVITTVVFSITRFDLIT